MRSMTTMFHNQNENIDAHPYNCVIQHLRAAAEHLGAAQGLLVGYRGEIPAQVEADVSQIVNMYTQALLAIQRDYSTACLRGDVPIE